MAILLLILSLFMISCSEANVGLTFDMRGTNVPNAALVRNFLNETSYIRDIRHYNMRPNVLFCFTAMNFSSMVGVDDKDIITRFSQTKNMENEWAATLSTPWPAISMNVYNVNSFAFGNNWDIWNMKDSNDNSFLDCMRRLQTAFDAVKVNIKVSTIIDSEMVLRNHDKNPSEARFREEYSEQMKNLLNFLRANKSPLMVAVYPFYKYEADPSNENLDFYLFGSKQTKTDEKTSLTYSNMFEFQVDAIRYALDELHFEDIEIVVAETGWPTWSNQNEASATLENSRRYNKNLAEFIRSGKGTPKMPNKNIKAYIHSLFDESRNGVETKRKFGVANTDLTWKYDI